MKSCQKCKTELPFSHFHKNKSLLDGLNPKCKSCRKSEYTKPSYRAVERVRRKRRYVPARQRAQRLKQNYGLTAGDYDRLLKSQNGACAICKVAKTADNVKGEPLHVDH
jgi:hypothetical protein